MKEALKQVSNLVERFQRNIEAYRCPAYNEAQLRREFIDPFFEALGWDVTNKAGYAEQYKDVIHEDAIKVAGATKAPDYCFRIGGSRKFFLETKKPSVDIKSQINPAYQLRRYAWSAKLPISILTDFEELAIYDCRFRPKPNDKPSVGRVRFYTYTQFLDSFEEIYNLLSKESVLKGSFDKFAESDRQKRGTTEVDAEFLKEIESWREALAKDIAIRNPKLSVRELNFVVQLTIDRIIFLRMCEDRGIEPYGQIQSLFNGTNTYRRLREIFYHADDKYNSGLFDFRTDRLTPELKVDDKPLKDIFKNLYYPESPYEFSVLGADILGHVYEQFLGKVIRLTEGHRAKVEEKPEVRKAGGVYYTPTYIVDYIVKNTVGKIVGAAHCGRQDEGTHRGVSLHRQLTPQQISKIRILDPACGSGSFLLGAYQYLLDYHRDWYIAHNPKNKNVAQGFSPAPKEIYQGRGGQWYLTTQEKKRILLNNIYGVDIDPQAVEVTKLSLLLKVLEGENQDTLERQMKLFKERALPDLGSNIKCGNSLIGPDFYQGKQMDFLDSEEIFRINPFDWEREFPEIMKHGGFDAVIGNPPYVFTRDEGFTEDEKNYFKRYKYQKYQLNTFALFTEKGFSLLRSNGCFGFIVPNNWLSISTMKPFRDFLVGSTGELDIINNFYKVFSGANVDTSIITFKKTKPTIVCLFESHRPNEFIKVASLDPADLIQKSIIQYRRYKNAWAESLLQKAALKSICLGDTALVKAGLKAYETGKGQPPQNDKMKKERVYHSKKQIDNTYRIYLEGKDVKRYQIVWSGSYLKYGINLAAPRDPSLFEGERILVRQIPSPPPYSINGVIASEKELNDINSMIIKTTSIYSLRYILGIINSKFISFWFNITFDKFQRNIFPQFKVNELSRFPIRIINFSDPNDKAQHDRMVRLVEQMLSFHKQLAAAKTPDEKTRLQRQIDTTDHQIDHLVYELYGLTDKEIQIIEEGTR